MQPPNPNPALVDPYTHLYATFYSSYYSNPQLQNPNPNPDPNKPQEPHDSGVGVVTGIQPPGIDPYSYANSHGGGYEAHQPGGVVYAQYQTVDAGAGAVPTLYYTDPNGSTAVQNWAIAAAQQYAVNPYLTAGTIPSNGTAQLVPTIPNSTPWSNPTIRPHRNGTWKRGPKKTKVVQSAWCEVCKVDCNTNDVLDKHKSGKKHKKNLEKLKPKPAPAPTVIGPQEKTGKGKKKRKKVESAEDLERKKGKILESGAAADAVRTCAICNVVCNSQQVFSSHLVGQKHVAMMKKHAAIETTAGMATAT